MLKIVYPICCGMDVHKSFLVACIAATNSQGVTTYMSKRFSTFTGDLRRCAAWLAEHNCKDVCMESTGKYWIPIYNILEPSCKIVLAHPKYVKAIRGKKTDKKDAKWIADIFKHDLVSGSFIPPADIRQLGIWYAIVGSLPTSQPARRTELRTVLLFPISNWMTCFRTYSEKRLPQSLLASWRIHPRESPMFPLFVPEA